MKKTISLFYLLLFFSNFPFFLAEIIAQTGAIAFGGNKVIHIDTAKEMDNANFADGDILYAREGIVLYEGESPSLSTARANGACLSGDGTTSISRCANFTVPDDYSSSYAKLDGWVYYLNAGGCTPIEWDLRLNDSQGNLLSEPYFIKSGETYNFCLGATMANNACDIHELCLTPYLVKTDYKIEHYLTKDNGDDLLNTLPGNSAKDYFAVSADGSDVSTFRIKPLDENEMELPNLKLRMKADPESSNENKYGSFEEPKRETEYIEIVYNHPALLPLSTNKEYEEYEVELIIDGTVLETLKLRVYRAPVVLVHGYRVDNSTFGPMKNFLANTTYYNDDLVTRANYAATSAKALHESSTAIRKAIDRAIGLLKDESIAAGKVDIVGHSMGGVLARVYLQSSKYKEDIFRLITLNTPHSGTQFADFMMDGSLGENLVGVANTFGFFENVDLQGSNALNDLRVNSIAMDELNIYTLNNNIVPSHTIATHQSYLIPAIKSLRTLPRSYIGAVIYAIKLGVVGGELYLKALYNNEVHDYIVPLSSQQGGITGTSSRIFSNQWHGSTKSSIIMNYMLSLLRESSKSSSFTTSGFSQVPLVYNNSFLNLDIKAKILNPSIDITSPKPNIVVTPGETITINVVGDNDITEVFAMIESNQDSIDFIRDESSTMNFEYTIGAYSGERKIVVIGRTADGTIVVDSAKIYICPSDLTLGSAEIINGVYQANNDITANGYLEDATKVKITAGNSITLTESFHAQRGTSLSATIEDCGSSTIPSTNITIDGNFEDWANTPTVTTNGSNGLNALKIYDNCEAIYVYVNGNLDAHFQLFIDSDFNATGVNEFASFVYANTGMNFMMEDAYPYEYTGSGEDWSWNQTSLDTEPFEINGTQLEMKIPKNIVPNLGSNINVGFVILNSNWGITGKLPTGDSGVPYSGAVCDNFKDADYSLLNTTKRNDSQLEEATSFKVFPNPFRETLSIALDVKKSGNYSLVVYDILGKIVAEPLTKKWLDKGNHQMTININPANSIYVLQLSSSDSSIAQKIVTQIKR